jgi:hypothetical protein
MKFKVQPIPFNQYGSNIPQFKAFEDAPAPVRLKSDVNINTGVYASPILLSEDDSPPSPPNLMWTRFIR